MEVVSITFVKPIAWISIPFFGALSNFATIQVNFGVKGFVTILCDILVQIVLFLLGTIQVLCHHVFDFFRPTHPTL
jgi:hypothetical protein